MSSPFAPGLRQAVEGGQLFVVLQHIGATHVVVSYSCQGPTRLPSSYSARLTLAHRSGEAQARQVRKLPPEQSPSATRIPASQGGDGGWEMTKGMGQAARSRKPRAGEWRAAARFRPSRSSSSGGSRPTLGRSTGRRRWRCPQRNDNAVADGQIGIACTSAATLPARLGLRINSRRADARRGDQQGKNGEQLGLLRVQRIGAEVPSSPGVVLRPVRAG